MPISFVQRECNWLQALEGDIDTSHFGFLHVGHLDPDEVPDDHPLSRHSDRACAALPRARHALGHVVRRVPRVRPETTYWRFAQLLFPFWTQTPQGAFGRNIQARAWVPIDDEHTMMIFWKQRNNGDPGTARR